jgi:acetyl-CoA carboxylase carboxyl transferase subunit alpha
MKITATDLLNLKVVDGIVEEPLGGAHRDPDTVIDRTGEVIAAALKDLGGLSRDDIPRLRREKFLAIGRSIQ